MQVGTPAGGEAARGPTASGCVSGAGLTRVSFGGGEGSGVCVCVRVRCVCVCVYIYIYIYAFSDSFPL